MEKDKKQGRYDRIYKQLEELLKINNGIFARMATINAVLHHKMENFFWTGFYLLNEHGELIVGPYQGPVACQKLKKYKGVCWTALNQRIAIIVDNVELFPGHIACDSRSKSEICLPVFNEKAEITAIFDIDSKKLSTFEETDKINLEKIVSLIYS